jgi:hypothetical protein
VLGNTQKTQKEPRIANVRSRTLVRSEGCKSMGRHSKVRHMSGANGNSVNSLEKIDTIEQ